jgi:hypothetical protein
MQPMKISGDVVGNAPNAFPFWYIFHNLSISYEISNTRGFSHKVANTLSALIKRSQRAFRCILVLANI